MQKERTTACAKATDKPVVLLSGGLDSGSILAAMLATGLEFGICAMQYGEYPTPDSELAQERHAAICPQISFETIVIKRSVPAAHDIANWCIANSGSVLKTAIECSVVMRPFIDAVLARGYRTLLNGMSGGMLWGVGRQAMMQLHLVSKEQGDAAGLKHWQDLKRRWMVYENTGFPPNATRVCRWYTGTKGGVWYDPLAQLLDLMSSADYAQLNRPFPKSGAVRAFPDLATTPVKAGGLQVVAGVRELPRPPRRSRGAHRLRGWPRCWRWHLLIKHPLESNDQEPRLWGPNPMTSKIIQLSDIIGTFTFSARQALSFWNY